ncbi:MAG: hypothetical protein IKB15_05710 [Alistipes sp.]|nr:hypothetical protein [Alistipes sp.]
MASHQFIWKFRKVFGEATPMSHHEEMLQTMPDSALYQKAFSVVKRRINGEIK